MSTHDDAFEYDFFYYLHIIIQKKNVETLISKQKHTNKVID